MLIPLSATASGNQVTITAQQPGYDGNMIRLYELHKNTNLIPIAHLGIGEVWFWDRNPRLHLWVSPPAKPPFGTSGS